MSDNISTNSDYTSTYGIDSHKSYAKDTYRLNFYGKTSNYAYLNISPQIIGKLRLTDGDIFTQELTDDNNILLRRISPIGKS
jgi:hypothetical protein